MNLELNPRLVDILLAQAKRHGTTVDQQAERFLRAGLSAERKRILGERATARMTSAPAALEGDGDVIIRNPCSEEYLRSICGDWWEECWWASSCAIQG